MLGINLIGASSEQENIERFDEKTKIRGLSQFYEYIKKIIRSLTLAQRGIPQSLLKNLGEQAIFIKALIAYASTLENELKNNKINEANVVNFIQNKKKEYKALYTKYGKQNLKTDPIHTGLNLFYDLQKDDNNKFKTADEAFELLATDINKHVEMNKNISRPPFTIDDLLILNPVAFFLATEIRRGQPTKILNLSKKGLTRIQGLNNIPENLKQAVQVIDLSNNHISDIPVGAFVNFPKLRRINLKKNQNIKTVAPDAFENLPSLKVINFGEKISLTLKDNLSKALKDRGIKIN